LAQRADYRGDLPLDRHVDIPTGYAEQNVPDRTPDYP